MVSWDPQPGLAQPILFDTPVIFLVDFFCVYSVAQTVVPQGQDGFWTWFTDNGVELPEARLPSGVVVDLIDGHAFPASSDTPSLPSVVSIIALPLYCLTTQHCQ